MGDAKASEGHREATAEPSWLDKELIQQALRNGGEENLQVAAFSVSRAVADGENYISTIYRAKVILSDGSERSFIVKGPTSGGLSALTVDCDMFQREITTLTDYIPKMEALLDEAAPGRFPPLAPRYYHHGTSPVEFLVLEDLATPGFKMADRRRGLGLRHSLLALRSLARYHAASYALLKKQPELIEQLGHILKSDNQGMQEYLRKELQATVIVCRSWPGFEEYAERLEKFESIIGAVFDKLNEPKPGAFNVITHGDFWANNIMYRYEDGNPAELRAVDWQQPHTSSPAIDILHFFASSLSEDVYEHHQDLLLREYHVELKATLELLGHQAPSLESLRSAVDDHGCYALYMAFEFPVVRADLGVDSEAMRSEDFSGFLRLFESPDVKKRVQHILQEGARKGWLST